MISNVRISETKMLVRVGAIQLGQSFENTAGGEDNHLTVRGIWML
jgi:hypothetical protein